MDVLERIAHYIETEIAKLNLRTESFRVEIEESTADIKESHFVLSWLPPVFEAFNTADSENSYNKALPPIDQTFKHLIPLRLIFVSKGSGQTWRLDMIRYTTEFNMFFHLPINIESMGPFQFMSVEFSRDSDSDVKEKVVESERNQGFFLEQHWTGYLIFQSKRNNT